MHEASLVQGLLEVVEKSVRDYNTAHPENRVARVTEIVCGAGVLASFEENTLRGCFEIFSENSIARGASLRLDTIPLPCVCGECSHKFEIARPNFVCPECGGENINFTGGMGLVLQALNVEREEKDD